jgi:predicted metal-dependent peptidase
MSESNKIENELFKKPKKKSEPVNADEAADLLMKGRCRLLTLEPWYGTMASLIDWTCADDVRTMGVRMKADGRVECLWSPKFVLAVGVIDHIMFVIKHEIEHIVRLHICRHGARQHLMSNFATDAVVNGPESSPHIANLPMIPVFNDDGEPELDEKGEQEYASPYYFPEGKKDLKTDSTFEEVYDWLDKNQKKVFIACAGCKGDLDSDVKKKPGPGQEVFDGTTIDDHSVWDRSEMSEDEARQVVKEMVEQSSKKAGSAPGHLAGAIEALQDPKINWRYLLRQWVGRVLGSRRETFSRRSRRNDKFGIPGKSNHASIPLIIGLDVSGSIAGSPKMLEQFFSEIEAMSHHFKISLVLWDAAIQLEATKYHRGDWRKIPSRGGGGTDVNVFFDYLKEKGLLNNIIVCITDGYVGTWPEQPQTPVLWGISTDVTPPWGQVVRIDVEV